jgi:hypothetical protein
MVLAAKFSIEGAGSGFTSNHVKLAQAEGASDGSRLGKNGSDVLVRFQNRRANEFFVGFQFWRDFDYCYVADNVERSGQGSLKMWRKRLFEDFLQYFSLAYPFLKDASFKEEVGKLFLERGVLFLVRLPSKRHINEVGIISNDKFLDA